MELKNVLQFYKSAVEEKRFSEDFLAEAKSISSEDKLRDFFEQKVLPIAQSMGYDFSADDLIAYERSVIHELSDEELESIAGGISLKDASATLLSMLMLAGNIHSMSSAMLPQNVIIESAGRLTGKSSSPQIKTAEEGNGAVAAATAASVTSEQEGLSKSDVVESTEPCKSTGSQYVCRALNLLDPYAMRISGLTEHMRFFDGNTQSLATNPVAGSIPDRQYNRDKGAGSPNYMRTLFPSSGGNLSTAGGSTDFARFTEDCKPSPELIAKIASYFYKFRCAKDQNAEMNKLGAYEKTLQEASNLTDDNLYDRLKTYCQARKGYEDAIEKRDKTVYKIMSVPEYLNWDARDQGTNAMDDELLNKIRFRYFLLHCDDTRCKEIKAAVKEIFSDDLNGKTDNEVHDYIAKLSYDKVKGNEKVMEQIEKLDRKTVLDDMKNQLPQYLAEVRSLANQLKAKEIRSLKPITFDMYINEQVSQRDIVRSINQVISANEERYQSLSQLMNAQEKGDDADKKAQIKGNAEFQGFCKEIRKSAGLNEVCSFFSENGLGEEVTEESLKTNEGIKKARAIITLLKEGVYMITNQEVSADDIAKNKDAEDKGTSEKYPKYTTERMLMSYFVEYFNTEEDVNKFYDQIDRENITDGWFQEDADRLEAFSKVIDSISKNEHLPFGYKGGDLISNGSAKAITVPADQEGSSQKKVKFNGSFADCADTVVRHLCNLLFYDSKGQSWLTEVVNEELEDAKKAVIEAIEKDGEVEFKELKDRVQMFFLHQKPSMTNDNSVVIRSLWNYVISNMSADSKQSDLYAIQYVPGQIYELETGFINMLKLMYNIEKVLFSESKKTVLQQAHGYIDKLDKEKSLDNLTAALRSVIQVVKSDVKVEVTQEGQNLQVQGQDMYGKLNVNIDDLIKVTIHHNPGHTEVHLSGRDRKALEAELKEFKEDPIIKYFVRRNFSTFDDPASDDFYENFTSRDRTSSYLATSHLLQLLRKTSRGEIDTDRLIQLCQEHFDASTKEVTMGKVDLFTFFQNIYRFSALKKLGINAQIDDFKEATTTSDGNYKYKRKGDEIEICPTAKLRNAEEITISPTTINEPNCTTIKISAGAFIGFTKLKKVIFGGVKNVKIGDGAFSFGNVKEVSIGKDTTTLELGIGVFLGASGNGKLNIADEVKHIEIGKVKFKDNSLSTIEMPANEDRHSIPDFAFSNLALPKTVTVSVASENFGIAAKIENLSVGEFAFSGSEVTQLDLGNAVKSLKIRPDAFSGLAPGFKVSHTPDTSIEVCEIVSPIRSCELKQELFSGLQGLKIKQLKISENVKELYVYGNAIQGLGIENLNFNKVVHLTIHEGGLSGFQGKELTIPETVKELDFDQDVDDDVFGRPILMVCARGGPEDVKIKVYNEAIKQKLLDYDIDEANIEVVSQ